MMATKLGEFSIKALDAGVTGARHRVAGLAASHGVADPILSDISLLASELVTNAVVHTKTDEVTILVTTDDRGRLRVSVRDDGSGGPIEASTADPMSEHGRGLLLLQLMAAEWGFECDDTTRTVWFEVTL